MTETLSPDEVNLLERIHDKMFRNFNYISDNRKFGETERWEEISPDFSLGDRFNGDCEEYAMHCRKILADNNIKSRLLAVYDEQKNGHCILLTEDGYCLDNRFSRLVTFTDLVKVGYIPIAISDYEYGSPWKKCSIKEV